MKLHAENSPTLRCSREWAAVVGARDLAVDICRGVRVDEVEVSVAFEKRAARELHAVPSDLRHRQRSIELADFSAQQTESGSRSHLMRYIEQQLMSDAHAEERRPVRYRRADRLVDGKFAQPLHRRREAPDSGEYDFLGGANHIRIARNAKVRSDLAQGARD